MQRRGAQARLRTSRDSRNAKCVQQCISLMRFQVSRFVRNVVDSTTSLPGKKMSLPGKKMSHQRFDRQYDSIILWSRKEAAGSQVLSARW